MIVFMNHCKYQKTDKAKQSRLMCIYQGQTRTTQGSQTA